MTPRNLRASQLPTCVLVVFLFAATAFAAGPREKVLHNFQGTPDGANPNSHLVAGEAGHFYGTTAGGGTGINCDFAYNDIVACGTVFELIPPTTPGGSPTERVIYSFEGGSDGSSPLGALIVDGKGNLYGTTAFGGGSTNCTTGIQGYYPGCGTVFRLSPPSTSGGEWTESILHVFQAGEDGGEPWGGLIVDAKGNLYGTTSTGGSGYCEGYPGHCGTAFELSPPSDEGGPWTETILYGFGASDSDGETPLSTLIFDRKGNLYGTTNAGGTGACSEYSCPGTVFRLTPPAVKGNPWMETVLFNFSQDAAGGLFPGASLIFDKSGKLYGTTEGGGSGACGPLEYYFYGCGTIFSLSPPASAGSWTLTTLYSFTGGSDGGYPQSGLVFDDKGNLYGTAPRGGGQGSCTEITGISGVGCGTVYRLTPPAISSGAWTETTLHAFSGGGDGATPYGSVILRDGILYGTTSGVSNYSAATGGTVFGIVP
jgi:hypothetical protein